MEGRGGSQKPKRAPGGGSPKIIVGRDLGGEKDGGGRGEKKCRKKSDRGN